MLASPATWQQHFPVAAGTRQSPIDIKLDACKSDGGLSKVKATYADVAVSTLQNTGSSWKAQVSGGKSNSDIQLITIVMIMIKFCLKGLTGGPLGEEFVLEQFHCHWGKSDKSGSEHTVDGTMYPAELHLVHWNKDKFKSFAEAAAADNGLTVLGIFLKANK
ncbi:Carbonic anhydrase 13 [Armadillidium vulgare]|nr:Carbonic anhydrase 13 [Armadillidium vulgare]